jgi:hypothetical protein
MTIYREKNFLILSVFFLNVNKFLKICYGRIIYVLCVKIICGQRGVGGRDKKRGRYDPS